MKFLNQNLYSDLDRISNPNHEIKSIREKHIPHVESSDYFVIDTNILTNMHNIPSDLHKLTEKKIKTYPQLTI